MAKKRSRACLPGFPMPDNPWFTDHPVTTYKHDQDGVTTAKCRICDREWEIRAKIEPMEKRTVKVGEHEIPVETDPRCPPGVVYLKEKPKDPILMPGINADEGVGGLYGPFRKKPLDNHPKNDR